MSATIDNVGGNSVPSSSAAITYQSVASIDKIEVVHDIIIKDFQEWRNNVDFLGDINGSFGIPISNKTPGGLVLQDVRFCI